MNKVCLNLTKNFKLGLLEGDIECISLIREHFSEPNPAYKRAPFASQRLYCITPQGKFEIGLTAEINNFCSKNNIIFENSDIINSKFFIGLNEPEVCNLNKTYRDYQEKSIFNAIKYGRGVIVIPTAGGKTLIMAGLIKSLMSSNLQIKRVLIIVPSIQLVEQTADDFISYGLENVSKWSGSNPYNSSASITVAGSSILLSKKTDLSVLADVDLLLVDEVHSVKRGNEINNVLKFIETPRRYGFTGTLPTSKIDQWNILGKFGSILYEEKTHSLKQQSYVSNFKIVILKIKHDYVPKFEVDKITPALAFQQETEFLINHERRNEIICNLSLKISENTLIMIDRIEHGERLLQKLSFQKEKPVYFIQGSTEIEEREKIRSLMESNRNVIVIAISKIFSTGINIPNLHNVIFASIGKAKIRIMQSIGRVLRLHPTKIMATIFDITDNTKYGKKHVEERKKMYALEKYEFYEKEI